jgi:hypothetical protein
MGPSKYLNTTLLTQENGEAIVYVYVANVRRKDFVGVLWNPQAQLNQQNSVYLNNLHVVCFISFSDAPWLSSNTRNASHASKPASYCEPCHIGLDYFSNVLS